MKLDRRQPKRFPPVLLIYIDIYRYLYFHKIPIVLGLPFTFYIYTFCSHVRYENILVALTLIQKIVG